MLVQIEYIMCFNFLKSISFKKNVKILHDKCRLSAHNMSFYIQLIQIHIADI